MTFPCIDRISVEEFNPGVIHVPSHVDMADVLRVRTQKIFGRVQLLAGGDCLGAGHPPYLGL